MDRVIKKVDASAPQHTLLVLDATLGMNTLSQAKAFSETIPLTGIIVTKLDGSSRGGGALSAVAATGAPIKFIGTGEKIEDIEPFIPSRFVGRLLGMGDLETLLEKVHDAEIKVPEKKAKEIKEGIRHPREEDKENKHKKEEKNKLGFKKAK